MRLRNRQEIDKFDLNIGRLAHTIWWDITRIRYHRWRCLEVVVDLPNHNACHSVEDAHALKGRTPARRAKDDDAAPILGWVLLGFAIHPGEIEVQL